MAAYKAASAASESADRELSVAKDALAKAQSTLAMLKAVQEAEQKVSQSKNDDSQIKDNNAGPKVKESELKVNKQLTQQAVKQQQARALPQTGNEQQNVLGILGVILMSVLSGLGLVSRKKVENN